MWNTSNPYSLACQKCANAYLHARWVPEGPYRLACLHNLLLLHALQRHACHRYDADCLVAAHTEAELETKAQQLQQLEGERDSLGARLQSRQAEEEDRDVQMASLQQVWLWGLQSAACLHNYSASHDTSSIYLIICQITLSLRSILPAASRA